MQCHQIHKRQILLITSLLVSVCTAHAEVTLCDCMNEPMDTDERVTTCTKIIDSLDPETSLEQRTECRNKPPPASGPDICYCLKTSYQDAEVKDKCSSMLEGINEDEMMKHIRSCAGKSF